MKWSGDRIWVLCAAVHAINCYYQLNAIMVIINRKYNYKKYCKIEQTEQDQNGKNPCREITERRETYRPQRETYR